MTERERFRTRGAYYAAMGNADAARDENEALIKRFPSDSTGLNNLALAYFNMWNFPRALELGKQAAAIYPGNVLRQSNVALFALYASDFPAAAAQAEHVLALNKDYPRGHLVLALTHLANGEVEPAIERYRTLGTSCRRSGREFSAHGLADIARYRGRLAEAATPSRDSPRRRRLRRRPARVSSSTSRRCGSHRDGLRRRSSSLSGLALAGPRHRDARRRRRSVRGRGPDAKRPPPSSTLLLKARRSGSRRRSARRFARKSRSPTTAPREARRILAETRQSADAWLLQILAGPRLSGAQHVRGSRCRNSIRAYGGAAKRQRCSSMTFRLTIGCSRCTTTAGLAREGTEESWHRERVVQGCSSHQKTSGDETGGLVADARKRVAGR